MSLFPPIFKNWVLLNLDTLEVMQGQFYALELQQNVSTTYAETWAINRQHAILQWLHGTTETTSFQAMFFAKDFTDRTPQLRIDQLKSWTDRSLIKGRPPILQFWVGDSHLFVPSCVIEKISNISYKEPTSEGGLRQVTCTVNLRQYTPFDITLAGVTDTRFHHARERDYYELVCQNEYGNPLLGDIIRKRNPTMPNLQVGDVVALPAIEGLRKEQVKQTSIALQTAFGKKDTLQRANRIAMQNKRNASFVSHIVTG